jgi:hypothetical protein
VSIGCYIVCDNVDTSWTWGFRFEQPLSLDDGIPSHNVSILNINIWKTMPYADWSNRDLSQRYESRIRIACDVITFCARGFRQRQIL